ncbi:MAG: DNA topoisomerase IV subunit A, partial [Burkholderiaceae bacterium]
LVACLSELGRLLVFEAAELRLLPGGGRGVTLMELQLGEKLVIAMPAPAAGLLVRGTGRGGKAMELSLTGVALAAQRGHRARKGKQLDIKWKPESLARLPVKTTA